MPDGESAPAAYLAHYKDAIATFSEGIYLFPNDARLYRHRGHRYLTLRCFDAAYRLRLGKLVLYNGKRTEAEKIFRQVTSGDQWSSFGYIAAESELNRGR